MLLLAGPFISCSLAAEEQSRGSSRTIDLSPDEVDQRSPDEVDYRSPDEVDPR